MNPFRESTADLPLKRSITLIYALSTVIAILMAAASISGLLYRTTIYPTDDLQKSFLPTDVVILFLGTAMLLGSMWQTRRSELVGLLLWPGALFFVLSNYLIYVFAMPFNIAYLLHLALVALSAYTLIGLIASIDAKAVQGRLASTVPERLAGGVLVGLGLLFFTRVIGVLLAALTSQTPVAETELALLSVDFLISPVWVICGLFLWRRMDFGYVTGLGLLFHASMLFIGLLTFLLLQPFFRKVPFALVDVLVISAMGLVCFIPLALFVRGVLSARSSSIR